MATVLDVAREAGVSPATVSRVINSSMLVSDEKKQLVYAAMEKVGYVIPIKDRPSRAGNGKLMLAITNISRYSLFEGMQLAAGEMGYGFVILQTSEVQPEYAEAISTLKLLHSGGQLAGIMLVNYNASVQSADLEQAIRNFPVVSVCEPLKGTSLVTSDDYQAAYDVTEHLISLGRRKIAFFVTRSPENRANFELQRIRGYRSALIEHGIVPVEELVYYSDFVPEGGYDTMRRLIKDGDLPDAIVCLGDVMAYGCMRALREHGISIPDDIAVVGMDDERESEYMAPPLTSVRQNFEEIGREAVRLLHKHITDSSAAPCKIFVPHTLVIRESSGGKQEEIG